MGVALSLLAPLSSCEQLLRGRHKHRAKSGWSVRFQSELFRPPSTRRPRFLELQFCRSLRTGQAPCRGYRKWKLGCFCLLPRIGGKPRTCPRQGVGRARESRRRGRGGCDESSCGASSVALRSEVGGQLEIVRVPEKKQTFPDDRRRHAPASTREGRNVLTESGGNVEDHSSWCQGPKITEGGEGGRIKKTRESSEKIRKGATARDKRARRNVSYVQERNCHFASPVNSTKCYRNRI